MRTLYVDTGAFVALAWRADQQHATVASHFLLLCRERVRLSTSDAVVAETATRLRYDAGLPVVLDFFDVLAEAGRGGLLRVRESDPALRSAAVEVLRQYADLKLSYADAVGAVVAREARADAVFGLDNDFRVMGFTLEP